MKSTLVDTDILINFLRGKRKAKDFLSMLLEESSIFCSAITLAEIAAGMRPGEARTQMDQGGIAAAVAAARARAAAGGGQ